MSKSPMLEVAVQAAGPILSFRTQFVYAVVLVDAIGFGLILPLIPFAMSAAGASPTAITLHLVTFAAGSLLAAPLVGAIGDRIGHALVIRAMLLVGLMSYLGMWLASSWIVFLLFRFIQGVSGAKDAALNAVLLENLDEPSRPQALATMGTFRLVGMFLGPVIGGSIAGLYAGSSSGGVSLVLLLAAGVAAVAFGVSMLLARDAQVPTVANALPQDAQQPLHRRLGQAFLLLFRPLAWNAGVGAAMGVIFSVTVLYMNKAFHLGPAPIGMILGVLAITVAVSRMVLVKPILSRLQPTAAILLLSFLLSLSMVGMAVAPAASIFVLSILGGGVFMGALPVLLNVAFEQGGPRGERGLVFGLATASFTLGQMMAATVSGVLFERVAIEAPYWLAAAALFLCVLDQTFFRATERSRAERQSG